MNRYAIKLVYDASSGEMRDDRKFMSMLEDYWLPRREGGKGTEITTLDGGQNLGEMEDVLYFEKKLYKALDIPMSRIETDSGFNMGRASEISETNSTSKSSSIGFETSSTCSFRQLLESSTYSQRHCK